MSKAEKNTGVVGHRRTGIQIMGQLIGLVRPLLPVMCAAILLGVIGYLCAIFLTILAGYGMIHGILSVLGVNTTPENAGFLASLSLVSLAVVLVVLAVLRGVLHYGEQYCNHFIAFKLLAIIRHQDLCGASKALSREAGRKRQGKSDINYHLRY